MAATHLTLEEAASLLGISPEDFKKRLKTDPLFKTLDRGKIRDGTSFRFKDTAVQELARELGAGSDPGRNSPIPSPATPARGTPKVKAEEPLKLSNDDDDDVFSLSSDDSKSGQSGPKTNKFRRSDLPPAEEIAIDFSGPASGVMKPPGGSSTKLSAPRSSTKLTSEKSGKNLGGKPPKAGGGDDSEFELSLDGSDDFELKLGGDGDDDALDLGEMPKETPGGSRVGRGGESGILSRKPNDTGRSLEGRKDPKSGSKSGSKGPKSGSLPPLPNAGGGDQEVDFELTLDAGANVSSTRLGGSSKSKKKLVTDSDSEFELTLDEPGSGSLEHAALGDSSAEVSKGDIFETDFEIPPMDPSGSEVVSDTTDIEEVLEEDAEAGSSEVVLLEDDEDAPKPKGRSSAARLLDDPEGDVDLADVEVDVEVEDESAAGALRGVKDTGADEDEEEELAVAGAAAGAYRPVPWGIWPLLFLLPAFALTLVGGLMGFELLQTMWGYQQPRKPNAPIVRSLAQQFDMEIRDQ